MVLFNHHVWLCPQNNSLWHHGLQYTRLPCPSLSPGVYSNSCPLSQWCHPTISSSVVPFSSHLPPFPASGSFPVSQFFLWRNFLWPKYWSFNFSVSPSNEFSELISFRIDWFDLLAVQGTLKSLLQHHHSKASILQRSAFFMIQLSCPHITTGKKHNLTIWYGPLSQINVSAFNMLSRFVITFLPRSKHVLISWLQSYSAVILEPEKRKSITVSTFSPSICHQVMGQDAMILDRMPWS